MEYSHKKAKVLLKGPCHQEMKSWCLLLTFPKISKWEGCGEWGTSEDPVWLCRAREHPAEQDRWRGVCSRAEAQLAALPFPAAERAFPRGLKAKTWQAIWQLDGNGEVLGIKNDHFPEIKTKPSHQFFPCIAGYMRILVNIESVILPLTPTFMLARSRFLTIYQREKAEVLFTEWYK